MHDREKHERIYVYVNCPFNVPGIDMMTTIIDSGTFYVLGVSAILVACNIVWVLAVEKLKVRFNRFVLCTGNAFENFNTSM